MCEVNYSGLKNFATRHVLIKILKHSPEMYVNMTHIGVLISVDTVTLYLVVL